jgi:glutamine cyclotransferase
MLATAMLVCGLPVSAPGAGFPDVPVSSVEVVHRWPHDPGAFTEGLLVQDGSLLESTGQYGTSALRRVDLATGRVVDQVHLDRRYFAEGVTSLGGKVYQLTWQEHRCFVYDAASLAAEPGLTYAGEAWGLTDDGTALILSDGTAVLRFLDPATLAVQRTIEVVGGGRPVTGLNELEYVDGEIFANVLNDRRIARIDPVDGALLGWIDLSDLVASVKVTDEDAVLNGIAYDARTGRLYVTGKRWPDLFEIRVHEPVAGRAAGSTRL